MRGGNGQESSELGGQSSRTYRLHSFDGAGGNDGRSTTPQSPGIGAGGAGRGDERGITQETWFEPVDTDATTDCPGGVCPVPWAVAQKELAPDVTTTLDIIVDNVNHPEHYAANGSIECIDAIEAQLTPEGYKGFLQGNCAKYLWRWRDKGGIEDLRKCKWYLDRLISSVDEGD